MAHPLPRAPRSGGGNEGSSPRADDRRNGLGRVVTPRSPTEAEQGQDQGGGARRAAQYPTGTEHTSSPPARNTNYNTNNKVQTSVAFLCCPVCLNLSGHSGALCSNPRGRTWPVAIVLVVALRSGADEDAFVCSGVMNSSHCKR